MHTFSTRRLYECYNFYMRNDKPLFKVKRALLIVVVLILCLTGYLFLRYKVLSLSESGGHLTDIMYAFDRGNYALALHSVFVYPVPLPTAMDVNFMTQVTQCFLPTAAVYGYDLRITNGFRSIADQTATYDQGRTINGHIISEAPPGHSLHNFGYAVDVVDRHKGYDIDWTQLIKIGAYCGLESGGVGDLPHFEERGGLSTYQFAAGLRPPLLTLPCPVMAQRAESSSTPLTLADLQACGAPSF
jgi:hypothetical protein